MKKILTMVICFCMLLENVAMALTTDAFSINLPSDFTMEQQNEESGEYTNGKITVSYIIKKNDEIGQYYKDPKEIKEEAIWSMEFLLLGFGKDSEIVRINNKNFLKDVSKIKGSELKAFSEVFLTDMEKNELNENDYQDVTSISYLGTTANRITIIKFRGVNLDESEVERIMSTIKLKGFSSKIYTVGINILVYGGGALLFIVLPRALGAKKKAKEKQSKTDNTFSSQQYQNSDNEYSTFNSQQDQNKF